MRKLEGRNAIVTGCNRGIGKAIFERLASEGANIIACVRNQTKDIKEKMQKMAERNNVQLTIVRMDLSDSESIKRGLTEIISMKLPIHILVNNAGLADFSGVARTKLDMLHHVFQVNYFSTVQIVQSLMLPMMKAKGASIINLASVAGIDGPVGNTSYGASKASLILASKCWSKELAAMKIRVNCIAPGLVDTDMNAAISESISEAAIKHLPLKRVCNPEEVASVAAFLASDDASYITGQTIRIDGGM